MKVSWLGWFLQPVHLPLRTARCSLSDLLQQGSFCWQPEHDVAFRELKSALLNSVVLQIVRFDRPFVMRTDASKVAVGAVLEQHSSEGEL